MGEIETDALQNPDEGGPAKSIWDNHQGYELLMSVY